MSGVTINYWIEALGVLRSDCKCTTLADLLRGPGARLPHSLPFPDHSRGSGLVARLFFASTLADHRRVHSALDPTQGLMKGLMSSLLSGVGESLCNSEPVLGEACEFQTGLNWSKWRSKPLCGMKSMNPTIIPNPAGNRATNPPVGRLPSTLTAKQPTCGWRGPRTALPADKRNSSIVFGRRWVPTPAPDVRLARLFHRHIKEGQPPKRKSPAFRHRAGSEKSRPAPNRSKPQNFLHGEHL
jgi:hypothetical protein